MLLLLLSHFSRVRLRATPWTLPGSSTHGIFQATVLEWVAIAFSKECIVCTNNNIGLKFTQNYQLLTDKLVLFLSRVL